MLVSLRTSARRHASRSIHLVAARCHAARLASAGSTHRLFAGAAGLAACSWMLTRPRQCGCDGAQDHVGNSEDDDDEFEFNFARPPVLSADIDLQSSVSVTGGLLAGTRPTAELVMSSTFSLPVERGWARDANTPSEVATSMCGVVADRLPRWVSSELDLCLTGAPVGARGFAGWPTVGGRKPPAALRCRWFPGAMPAVLSLQKLEHMDGEKIAGCAYLLGGMFCAGRFVLLRIACEPIGISKVATESSEQEERLDIRLTTRLVGLPLAGRGWIIGSRWWWKRVRMPFTCDLLERFHCTLHDQLALHFVAALVDDSEK